MIDAFTDGRDDRAAPIRRSFSRLEHDIHILHRPSGALPRSKI
jgi:hypothetical protein